jgi:hypothetical protein
LANIFAAGPEGYAYRLANAATLTLGVIGRKDFVQGDAAQEPSHHRRQSLVAASKYPSRTSDDRFCWATAAERAGSSAIRSDDFPRARAAFVGCSERGSEVAQVLAIRHAGSLGTVAGS